VNLPLLEKWLNLPPEIADQPFAAINTYLANLSNGSASQPLKQVRAIFIGYGDAGKTSLIRALHGEPVVAGQETMTPGIDIREWHGAGNGITTHFWDFGGKVMAHSTHPFFLRSSCLYVLVLNERDEMPADEQAQHWLQHIKVYGGESPVIIVRNKADQRPLHLDMVSLKQKYPNIVADFSLACTQAHAGPLQARFAAFENAFRDQINDLSQHQTLFTDAQFAVLQGLQAATKQQALLEHNEFQILCDQHNIPLEGAQNRDWLLDLFDKLGVLIHFPQLDQLQEHILNPRWLTYGVYQIMLAGRPHLRPADFIDLLHNVRNVHNEHSEHSEHNLNYPQHKCQFIALAMICFKLCHPLRGDEGQLVIPGLLETDLPAGVAAVGFNQAQALAYKINFNDFVPRHVVPELIVLHNTEIIGELVWQYGALLQHPEMQAKAWIQVDYSTRELSIWAQERNAKEYLAILRHSLLKILARLTLSLRESIRLPKSALSPAQARFDVNEDWAVYQQIEAYIKRGDKTFVSETGHEYDLTSIAKAYLVPDSDTNRTGVITAGHTQDTIKRASAYSATPAKPPS
jgi:GTPase SAR1 family protein